MLCVQPDRPLIPCGVRHARGDAVAKDLCLPYFLIGAMARDVLLGHVLALTWAGDARRGFCFPTRRLGAIPADTEQTHSRVGTLSRCAMSLMTDVSSTLRCPGTHGGLAPFVELKQSNKLSLASYMQMLMSVAGYGDALQTAPPVQIVTD